MLHDWEPAHNCPWSKASACTLPKVQGGQVTSLPPGSGSEYSAQCACSGTDHHSMVFVAGCTMFSFSSPSNYHMFTVKGTPTHTPTYLSTSQPPKEPRNRGPCSPCHFTTLPHLNPSNQPGMPWSRINCHQLKGFRGKCSFKSVKRVKNTVGSCWNTFPFRHIETGVGAATHPTQTWLPFLPIPPIQSMASQAVIN